MRITVLKDGMNTCMAGKQFLKGEETSKSRVQVCNQETEQ